MAKRKRIAKNEFRYNYTTKHHNYIFEEDGKYYHGLGLTKHPYTRDDENKWQKNMPLKHNPQRNKQFNSYIRYGYITQNKNTFGKVDRRFKFSDKDKPNVKAKVKHFKNKRRKKK